MKVFLESFPEFLGCSLKVICVIYRWVTGHILNYKSSRLTRACAIIRTTLFGEFDPDQSERGGMVEHASRTT